MQILRSIAAIVVGLIVTVLTISIIHAIGHRLFPLPEGIDPHDTEALKKAIPSLPAGAFLMVVVAWEGGAFAGSFVSALIAGRARIWHALPNGLFVLAASIAMFYHLPHPDWTIVAGLLMPMPMSMLAGKLASLIFPPQTAVSS
jgi:hypothetical protein